MHRYPELIALHVSVAIGVSEFCQGSNSGIEMERNKLGISNKWVAMLAVTAGLVSYQADAIEEVVVYGTDASPVELTMDEQLKRDMKAYVDALNLEEKAKISAALANQRATEIQIAAVKAPTRG